MHGYISARCDRPGRKGCLSCPPTERQRSSHGGELPGRGDQPRAGGRPLELSQFRGDQCQQSRALNCQPISVFRYGGHCDAAPGYQWDQLTFDLDKSPATMGMSEIATALAQGTETTIPNTFVTSASVTPSCPTCFGSYWDLN